jgi:hypothetical protein
MLPPTKPSRCFPDCATLACVVAALVIVAGCSRSTIPSRPAIDGGADPIVFPEGTTSAADDSVVGNAVDNATDDAVDDATDDAVDDSSTDDATDDPTTDDTGTDDPADDGSDDLADDEMDDSAADDIAIEPPCPPGGDCTGRVGGDAWCDGNLRIICAFDAEGCPYEASRNPDQASCPIEDCTDGADNDGDAAVDCADADCAGSAPCIEICANGVDDDRDGQIDCADVDCAPECTGCATDVALGSALGVVATGSTVNQGNDTQASCGGDSLSDDLVFSWSAPVAGCYTFDTFGSNFDTTLHIHNACPTFDELRCNDDAGDDVQSMITLLASPDAPLSVVVDGFDAVSAGDFTLNISPCFEECADFNDNDLDGLWDCDDPDCALDTLCIDEICNNGIDDDGDANVDCLDAECQNSLDCQEDCTDGVDNNMDGDIDCADASCTSASECVFCPAFDGDLGSQIGSISGSTVGSGAEIPASCAGGGESEELLFAWTPPVPGCYEFDTFGSDYDTALHVHTACPEFTELACNDDDDVDVQSWLRLMLPDTLQYLIAVDGFSDSSAGDFTLNIAPCVEQCGNGSDDDLDGAADCADPDCALDPECIDEICNNGVDDDGDGFTDCADNECTSQTLCDEICDDGVDNDADGALDCMDSECTSSALCIQCPATDFALGTMTGFGVASGTTVGAVNDATSTCAATSASADLVFAWEAPASGCFTIDTDGSTFDTSLHVHSACPEFTELQCDDDAGVGTQSSTVLTVVGGTTYLIVVDGYGSSNEGPYVLNINACP